MRIVCISDTHTRHESVKLPEGDMLIVAGDVTSRGYFLELKSFAVWLYQQKFKYKIIIAGNHDVCFQDEELRCRNFLSGVCYYLQDEFVYIEKFKIYGSPWQPWFGGWAFNANEGELAKIWNEIPVDTDILVTHGPPMGFHDINMKGDLCGCNELYKKIVEISPRVHIYGHIHEGYGQSSHYFSNKKHLSVNCSICTSSYSPTNKPIVVEL
jgi:Icc-related predicted phosphoesterase